MVTSVGTYSATAPLFSPGRVGDAAGGISSMSAGLDYGEIPMDVSYEDWDIATVPWLVF